MGVPFVEITPKGRLGERKDNEVMWVEAVLVLLDCKYQNRLIT